MNKLLMFSASIIIILSFACTNSSGEKAEPQMAESSASAETSSQTPFSTVMMIQHKVGDFEKWLTVFNQDEPTRKKNGLSLLTIGRGDDPSMVYITMKADNAQKALDFTGLTETRETMKKSGVSNPPMIYLMNIVRNDNPKSDYKERLMVEYHVKDFDVWLKAFDEEGKETRAAKGLLDRSIARDVADSNRLYLLFDISNRLKAEAWAGPGSKELEKFMSDAGVDSPPMFQAYKLVD